VLVPRTAEASLRADATGYPIVAVTGPRQSGKTTLVRLVFPDKPYASLEDPDRRELAASDPRGFLAAFPDGAVLDEIQRCPELFSYLQGVADSAPRMGHFVLTGSQQFGLLAGISQSLAGRVALTPLLPFSYTELAAVGRAPATLDTLLAAGLYPPVYDRDLEPGRWYANYVQTYLERDVRHLVNVRDLSTFQRFLRLCAGRTGQLLNLSTLADDTGVAHNTVRSWISVLEASYLVHLLAPHHRNFNKRLLKTPKLYFVDPGLAAWLLGIEGSSQLASHPLRGPLFETWVVSELLKARLHRGLPSNLFFWRDRSGHEVDVIADHGVALSAIEVKAGRTVAGDMLSGLRFWRSLAGDAASDSWLVYGGDEAQHRTEAHVLPWREIARLGDAVAGRQDPGPARPGPATG
jgi:hypothetical protein